MNLLLKIIIFLFPVFLFAEDEPKIPELKSRVMDEAFVLTESDKTAILDQLKELEKTKGSQIAVLTIDTTGDLTISEYGIKVAEKWKLGRKGVSDGAILIVAVKDKRMRIEVGRGLEEFLTDLRTKQIQERIIKPEFKKKNMSGGIRLGVEAMVTVAKGAELSLLDLPKKEDKGWNNSSQPKQFLFFAFFVGLVVLIFFVNTSFGMMMVSFVSTAIVFFMGLAFSGFLLGFIAAVISLIIYMIIIYFRSGSFGSGSSGGGSSGSGYYSSGGGFYTSGSDSGGWSGGGSSSGGSDSFSGGGGDFGGGGSSSDWD